MIAALMHEGRTVLFVSEKAAALDVVRNRLREVGLGDFALSLHSGDTAKKAVATELARVLTTEARVTGAAEHELERARRLREELSCYAGAMNQVREPLGRTLHDVLGHVVLLEQDDTPRLPLSAAHRESVGALSAGRILTQVIQAEGPIHEELLVQRAREAWGARAGSRIRENIRQVVRGLRRTGAVSADGDFLDTADRQDLKARHPADGTTARQAAHIAPAERRLALRELAAECPGMSRDELLRQACDFFGWRRLGQDIRAALESDVAELYAQGVFMGAEGRITVTR
ncbi:MULTISPECIES: DUF3320 domain-containing protein [Streptomyces]